MTLFTRSRLFLAVLVFSCMGCGTGSTMRKDEPDREKGSGTFIWQFDVYESDLFFEDHVAHVELQVNFKCVPGCKMVEIGANQVSADSPDDAYVDIPFLTGNEGAAAGSVKISKTTECEDQCEGILITVTGEYANNASGAAVSAGIGFKFGKGDGEGGVQAGVTVGSTLGGKSKEDYTMLSRQFRICCDRKFGWSAKPVGGKTVRVGGGDDDEYRIEEKYKSGRSNKTWRSKGETNIYR